jgi:hypothetical protein
MSNDIELLACPFCGSKDVSDGEVLTAYPTGKQTKQSMCNSCKALGSEALLDDGEIDYGDVKAIAAWNTRAALAAPQQKPVAWMIESNVSSDVRCITMISQNEQEIDRFVKAYQAKYSGSNRIKIPLYTVPLPPAAPALSDEEITSIKHAIHVLTPKIYDTPAALAAKHLRALLAKVTKP